MLNSVELENFLEVGFSKLRCVTFHTDWHTHETFYIKKGGFEMLILYLFAVFEFYYDIGLL